MCHDPLMALHSLSLSKGRQINITLLILVIEGLREALVNFDVSPKTRVKTREKREKISQREKNVRRFFYITLCVG